ncbi:hypothetical protein EHS25_003749 [Saitozyma podzolica]|uniref:Uncharacterized protein n=1 Tax=Saitozyma podzolica TaxID=1890683 RepID=A0A427Y3C6_9TREE|nr:hypothetical protein EHS25_003749 [Saitozyma podzolica]
MSAPVVPVPGPVAVAVAEAGPSRLPPVPTSVPRKPRAPHPSKTAPNRRRLPIPLPPKTSSSRPGTDAKGNPTVPIKPLQGVGTRRTDATRNGYGREVVFVTRKTGLGTLLGRCKSLVMDEGYTRLTLHALSAAIPQALMLLHALLDVLPYPRGLRGMWYEIRTGSVECTDEVPTASTGASGVSVPQPDTRMVAEKGRAQGRRDRKSKPKQGPPAPPAVSEGAMDVDGVGVEHGDVDDDGMSHLLAGIGAIEESEPLRQHRIKSSIQIDLHIGPRPPLNGVVVAPSKTSRQSAPGEGKARPNKKRRQALARKLSDAGNAVGGVADQEMDEEMMMNLAAEEEQGLGVGIKRPGFGLSALGDMEEEEEEIEEIE